MLIVVLLNVIMLDVVMLDVVMLDVVMLNVIMLSVMAPFKLSCGPFVLPKFDPSCSLTCSQIPNTNISAA
jgi:hypothetical protein